MHTLFLRYLIITAAIALTACDSGIDSARDDVARESAGEAMGPIQLRATQALVRLHQHENLNAFISVDENYVMARARALDEHKSASEVYGMLIAVKDNIHVAALPNSAGTPALKNFVPTEDNPVIARLKESGVVVLGKANMHELAFGITSNNGEFGPVRNPSDLRFIAGGSSGGTAAAVAAGIVDAGLGTDTGGSVRIPAALTGVVGFRPTLNRYPSGGVTPISTSRDTIGPIAKDVATIIQLDSAIMRETEPVQAKNPADLRLGVARSYFYENLDQETAIVAEKALKKLEDEGIQLIEVEVANLAALLEQASFPIALYEVMAELPVYLNDFNTEVSMEQLIAALASPDVAGVFGAISGEGAIPDQVYSNALVARNTLQAQYASLFSDHQLDGIIFPTTILPARPIGESDEFVVVNGVKLPTFPAYIHNTDPGSIAGIPGISIPAGRTSTGLPVAMAIDGPENSDRDLLSLARSIEDILAR